MRAEDYLATTYRPDCDYVDGTVVERNVGRKDHSCLLGEVLAWFHERRGLPLALHFPRCAFASHWTAIASWTSASCRYLFEPTSKRAWWIAQDGHFEAVDGVLRTRDGPVVLPISELFDN